MTATDEKTGTVTTATGTADYAKNMTFVQKDGSTYTELSLEDAAAAVTAGKTVYVYTKSHSEGYGSVWSTDYDYTTYRTGIQIGEDSDVVIVAGCGIDNCGSQDSEHDGVHRFFVGKNAKIRYVEKHYGEGDGTGKRILNPVTEVYQEEGSYVDMEMVQIKGVDSTLRTTLATLKEDATFIVHERLMTHGNQSASSEYKVELNGKGSSTDVISRSVAKDSSEQIFEAAIVGNKECSGHAECDAIIMGDAHVVAVPRLDANCVDASLIHEAAIGKIAGDQLIKLMTLGLNEEEAEEQIIAGFLR